MDISKKIKPLGDRLIVRRLDAEEKTKSGIIIPESAKEKPQQGEVLAVGPGGWDADGKERRKIDVKVGDIVIFEKYAARELKWLGEDILSIKEEDAMAVLVK